MAADPLRRVRAAARARRELDRRRRALEVRMAQAVEDALLMTPSATTRRWVMERKRWTAVDIPDQDGRTAVVTGGNSGIPLGVALVIA